MPPDKDDVIPPVLAQRIVKWVAGILLAGLVPIATVTLGYVKNIATTADVESAIEMRLNRFDHNTELPLEPDRKRPRAPQDGYATSIAIAWVEVTALQKRSEAQAIVVEQQRKQLIELWRWHVRWLAADAEQDRRKRMTAGEVAKGRFDQGIAEGMTPESAARYALETNPYGR